MTRFLPSLSPIAARYDGFLLDLWGVIHDGEQLYPGVRECLAELKKAGKKIIFLSNAPRRAYKAQTVLDRLGITRDIYDNIVTSGEAGLDYLTHDNPFGTRFFFIGPERDADLVEGLDYTPVANPKDADFILNAGFRDEDTDPNCWQPQLKECIKHNLPMVCLNPDMEIVKLDGTHYPCAGEIAAQYEALGGKVMYFGKPYPVIYTKALAMMAPLQKRSILAVGDNLDTDIKGAKDANIDVALVLGGVLGKKTKESPEVALAELCKGKAAPDFAIPRFNW